MSYRVRVRVAVPKFEFTPAPGEEPVEVPATIKTARIRLTDGALLSIPVYARDNLRPGHVMAGPAIVRQLDATTLLPPGWTARRRLSQSDPEARGAEPVDNVTVQLAQSVASLMEEMHYHFFRSGYSTIVRECAISPASSPTATGASRWR
jgi:hypothetical protein